MFRLLAAAISTLLVVFDLVSVAHSAPKNPLAGKMIDGEYEALVKVQSTSVLGGLLGQKSETALNVPLRLAIDRLGNVFQFSPVGDSGKFDKGEVLKLNQEIDLASHPERVDPRVLASFSISSLKFRTSLADHVLMISGELDFIGKNDGARLQQTIHYEISFSPAYTDCTIQSYSSRRTIGPPQSVAADVTLRRQIRCTVSRY